MNIESFRNYCLSKPGASEDFPFDESTIVFKVGGKIFALADIEIFESINLKCDPERAVELRELHEDVRPGFHMNKRHWNTVIINNKLPEARVLEMVDHSYTLVYQSLPLRLKNMITGASD